MLQRRAWWIECVTWCSAQGKEACFQRWGSIPPESGDWRLESKGQRPARFVPVNYHDLTGTKNSQETDVPPHYLGSGPRQQHLLFKLGNCVWQKQQTFRSIGNFMFFAFKNPQKCCIWTYTYEVVAHLTINVRPNRENKTQTVSRLWSVPVFSTCHSLFHAALN